MAAFATAFGLTRSNKACNKVCEVQNDFKQIKPEYVPLTTNPSDIE